MKTKLLSLFTRTPLHVGAGASVGAVDQPVVRERHTGYPVIPGSALKGVLADLWLDRTDPAKPFRNAEGKKLFGEDDLKAAASAGKLLVGESKLLAFPVRSAKGCFAWITCPFALARFDRDARRRFAIPAFAPDAEGALIAPGSDLVLSTSSGKDVVFEEYSLKAAEDGKVADLANALGPLSSDKVWQDLLARKLAVVGDDLFAYFAKNACQIAQHNRISDVTNTVDGTGFFNQENVPSETLFYATLSCEDVYLLESAEKTIRGAGMLQVGADMTTGLGWCTPTVSSID